MLLSLPHLVTAKAELHPQSLSAVVQVVMENIENTPLDLRHATLFLSQLQRIGGTAHYPVLLCIPDKVSVYTPSRQGGSLSLWVGTIHQTRCHNTDVFGKSWDSHHEVGSAYKGFSIACRINRIHGISTVVDQLQNHPYLLLCIYCVSELKMVASVLSENTCT